MTTLQRTATEIAAPKRQLGTISWKWMVTTDHKVIGNLCFITSMLFFFLGGILVMTIYATAPKGSTGAPARQDDRMGRP